MTPAIPFQGTPDYLSCTRQSYAGNRWASERQGLHHSQASEKPYQRLLTQVQWKERLRPAPVPRKESDVLRWRLRRPQLQWQQGCCYRKIAHATIFDGAGTGSKSVI